MTSSTIASAATTRGSADLTFSGEGVRLWARSGRRAPLLLVAGFVLAILTLGLALGSLPAMVGLATVLTFGIGLMVAMQRDLTTSHALLLGSSHLVGALLLV